VTIDKLRVPDNYTRGATALLMTDADDKEAYGREVPLSLRARRALDSVLPKHGPIFGHHDYVIYLRRVRRVLPPHKGKVFTWQHLRSARITHWLEKTGDLPGVMYLAGHKHASTTSRYVRPSMRAAQNVLRRAR
jgi:integrase